MKSSEKHLILHRRPKRGGGGVLFADGQSRGPAIGDAGSQPAWLERPSGLAYGGVSSRDQF